MEKAASIGELGQSPSVGRFAVLVLGAIAFFVVAGTLAEQAGMPSVLLVLSAGIIWTASVIVTGFVYRTSSLGDWQFAGKRADASVLAMNNAVTIIPGSVFLLLPGLFFLSDPRAVALMTAIPAAAILAGFLLNPALRTNAAGSVCDLLEARFANSLVRSILLVCLGLVAVLLLWTELHIAAYVAGLIFGLAQGAAVVSAAFLVALSVLAGGTGSVLRLGVLGYLFLAAAFLAPLVWIATTLTGFPVPQLAYGAAALGEIATLENAMTTIGIPLIETVIAGSPTNEEGFPGAFLTFVLLTAGLCTLPATAALQRSSPSLGHNRRANGWTMLLLGLLLSAIPAAAAFAKLSLYNTTLGLTTGEIAEQTPWVLWWGNVAAASGDSAPLVALCGKAVTSAQSAIDACGGNPDHSITPNDLSLRIEAVFLALPQTAGLPLVFFLLAALSVATVSLATANATLLGVASLFCPTSREQPGGRTRMQRLFSARLGIIVVTVISALMAITSPAHPFTVLLWAMAICAAVIAPAVVTCIWSRRAGPRTVLAGMIVPLPILVSAFWLGWWLDALSVENREQIVGSAPLLGFLLNPVTAGLMGLAAAAVAIGVGLVLEPNTDRSRFTSNEPLADQPKGN